MDTFINVNISGIPEVMEKLERFGRKTKEDLSLVVVKYTEQEADAAREFLMSTSPYPTVDTGILVSSIDTDYSIGAGITRGKVEANTSYARYVAWGRRPGSYPPPGPLKQWADRKGVPYFPVLKAIAQRGIPAKPFIRKPWSKLRPAFMRDCVAVVRRNSRYWRNV